MIPKAQLLLIAKHTGLQPTTVQKDYVIGWILRAISKHEFLSRWVFKGGTCLKKCFFETYRFSEDLDFSLLDQKEMAARITLQKDRLASTEAANDQALTNPVFRLAGQADKPRKSAQGFQIDHC